MGERLQNNNEIFQSDLNQIGLVQLDNRNWISENYLFTRLDWRDLSALNEVSNIQNEVWKFGDKNTVPPNILAIIEETGGDLLTVFNTNGKQEAFTLSLATNDPNKLFLHMVGVVPNKQSENVGRKIMQLEGALARSKGIKEIQWTYDPLMGANSQLYLARLKAVPYKYTINKYGIVKNENTQQESRYKNIETDRFTVKWNIGDQNTWNSSLESSSENTVQKPVETWGGEGTAPDVFKIGVPYDFTKLSTDEMMDARMELRKVAVKTLDFDNISHREYKVGTHVVTTFIKDPNHVTNFYIFSKKS